jgi:hypothetical protein
VSTPGALEVAVEAAHLFERLEIPYVIVGSVASSIHGEPRATLDIDVTLHLRAGEIALVAGALGHHFHIEESALRDAVATGHPCNAIHRVSHVKLDLYVKASQGIHAEELRRAWTVRLTGEEGSEVRVASPEDTVLQKLAWYRKGGEVSDRQWRDVLGVLKTRGDRLERDYLAEWSVELGVADLLRRALLEAGLDDSSHA